MTLLRSLAVLLTLAGALAAGAREVTLTFILVPETIACGGGNYVEANCREIKIHRVEQWAAERPHMTQKLKVGANPVTLKGPFFDKLRRLVDYETFPKNAANRWAMVMLFEVKPKQATLAVLERESGTGIDPDESNVPISPAGRGFTHQRADAFKPSKEVAWALRIGEDDYRFYTKRPQ